MISAPYAQPADVQSGFAIVHACYFAMQVHCMWCRVMVGGIQRVWVCVSYDESELEISTATQP